MTVPPNAVNSSRNLEELLDLVRGALTDRELLSGPEGCRTVEDGVGLLREPGE
jgi:hypothetical protein